MTPTVLRTEPSRGRRVLRAIATAQLRLAMLAAAVIVLTTTADVVLRYAFGRPIHGAYDVTECMLVLFVFHGLSAVFLDRGNITIDLVDHFVGARTRGVLVRLSDLVSVGVLILVASAMIAPALQAFDYGDRKLELGWPLWIVWAFALTGILGTIVSVFGAASDRVAPAGQHG